MITNVSAILTLAVAFSDDSFSFIVVQFVVRSLHHYIFHRVAQVYMAYQGCGQDV